MAKKKSGKHYVSKGLYPANGKRDPKWTWTQGEREAFRFEAWVEGRPVSKKTLLRFGPRNANEQGLFQRLRKATQGINLAKRPMDYHLAIKETS